MTRIVSTLPADEQPPAPIAVDERLAHLPRSNSSLYVPTGSASTGCRSPVSVGPLAARTSRALTCALLNPLTAEIGARRYDDSP